MCFLGDAQCEAVFGEKGGAHSAEPKRSEVDAKERVLIDVKDPFGQWMEKSEGEGEVDCC